MGFVGELEGESLAEVTTGLLTGKLIVDESLPLVVTGRAPWRTDIEARGVTVTLRAIPVRHRGERVGAIVLVRDVSEVRHQEQELITKDATIREIHHRVKNNLQTVASLLRIQSAAHAQRGRARRAQPGDAARGGDRGRARHPQRGAQPERRLRRRLRPRAAADRRGGIESQHDGATQEDGHVRHAAERVRDAARARAHRARHQRGRARARRARRRGRDLGDAARRPADACGCATTGSACPRARSAQASARRSCAR